MTPGLSSLLHPGRAPRILLVGDMILDRYQYGSTERVSPEAPIVVLAATREEHLLGGCGNVAANLAALGAQVSCVSVVGDDEAASRVRGLLVGTGLDAGDLVTDGSRPTIRKTRVVSQSQQLLRIDEEQVRPLDASVESAVLARLEAHLRGVDIVVVSDYGKGVLTERVLERLCRVPGGPRVVVDPKGRSYGRYRGAYIITPNKLEAETATGIALDGPDGIRRAALELCRIAGLHAAVITLGAKGMYCCLADGSQEWTIPAVARSVYDVTGAGDTVLAVMAFTLAGGADLADAMRLATLAAGIVVQRVGVVAVTPVEIERALHDTTSGGAKVLGRAELAERVLLERRAGRAVVFTNGCFDVLHVGHLQYLQEARALGDVLVVGVNADASVTRLKGAGRPVNRQADRAALLAGLECVSFVTVFDEDTPLALIRELTPDVLVKGADWKDKGVVGSDWVEAHGGRVVLAAVKPGYSTTATLERVATGRGAPDACDAAGPVAAPDGGRVPAPQPAPHKAP
ncbi:MAG TPA: D-glycero-beta-D-manno-heptose 1-phosphate adenylyltransferase [Planctomycetota bacterium]|nr:D-glycero-beta-D-manno-heptose 1-phosphate adenylyltransferase [Planctomycetota bacterium]